MLKHHSLLKKIRNIYFNEKGIVWCGSCVFSAGKRNYCISNEKLGKLGIIRVSEKPSYSPVGGVSYSNVNEGYPNGQTPMLHLYSLTKTYPAYI